MAGGFEKKQVKNDEERCKGSAERKKSQEALILWSIYHTMYERREGQKWLGRRNMKGKHDRKGERRKGLLDLT